MSTVCEKNQCSGCMACIDSCPVSAIKIVNNFEAYNAVIDEQKCIGCESCHRVCQSNNPAKLKPPIEWKQGWAEGSIRRDSSSGGFATALLKSFVDDSSFVASCKFENGKFIFDITNDINDLDQFSGSRYVKSNPIGIYQQVEYSGS